MADIATLLSCFLGVSQGLSYPIIYIIYYCNYKDIKIAPIDILRQTTIDFLLINFAQCRGVKGIRHLVHKSIIFLSIDLLMWQVPLKCFQQLPVISSQMSRLLSWRCGYGSKIPGTPENTVWQRETWDLWWVDCFFLNETSLSCSSSQCMIGSRIHLSQFLSRSRLHLVICILKIYENLWNLALPTCHLHPFASICLRFKPMRSEAETKAWRIMGHPWRLGRALSLSKKTRPWSMDVYGTRAEFGDLYIFSLVSYPFHVVHLKIITFL